MKTLAVVLAGSAGLLGFAAIALDGSEPTPHPVRRRAAVTALATAVVLLVASVVVGRVTP